MRSRLPVNIEKYELPEDNYKEEQNNNNNSYGFVNFFYLLAVSITLSGILVIIFFKSRWLYE